VGDASTGPAAPGQPSTLGLPRTDWVGPARSCTSATGLDGMEVPPSHGNGWFCSSPCDIRFATEADIKQAAGSWTALL
jgi:hypothetical protein